MSWRDVARDWWRKGRDWARDMAQARVRIKSLAFLHFALVVSFAPILLYIGVWSWIAIWGQGEPPLLNLLQELRQFIATIFSPAVLAAVVSYGAALIDDNNDGQSDDWASKIKKGDNMK